MQTFFVILIPIGNVCVFLTQLSKLPTVFLAISCEESNLIQMDLSVVVVYFFFSMPLSIYLDRVEHCN